MLPDAFAISASKCPGRQQRNDHQCLQERLCELLTPAAGIAEDQASGAAWYVRGMPLAPKRPQIPVVVTRSPAEGVYPLATDATSGRRSRAGCQDQAISGNKEIGNCKGVVGYTCQDDGLAGTLNPYSGDRQ